jgi:HJR/Mrr/RecB family endonuclease
MIAFRLWGLEFTQWLKVPSKSYQFLRYLALGVCTTFPISVAALCFAIFGFVPAVVATFLATLCIAFWLYRPYESQLPFAIQQWKTKLAMATLCLEHNKQTNEIEMLTLQLRDTIAKRDFLELELKKEIADSLHYRRELLRRNWKAMRDDEWENYLLEICLALGKKAERIGRTGDQGVDLVVESGTHRIAVQAKGYFHAVSNKAVQEVYAGMTHHDCTRCAVITNSRFTKSAREIAVSTGCYLIGEDEFSDFVLGKSEWLDEPMTG